jgi:hypothetical protein
MFDNSGTPSLELLRFRPEFGGASGFEDALRERVAALKGFDHPAFSQVRAVERLDSGDLVLVSTVTTGKRVSEIFRGGQGRPGVHPAFAAWFIRESVSAIAALQQQIGDIAHAALTPDRVILAPNGRLVVVEHVLGAALDRLRLTVRRLQDFGRCPATVTTRAPDQQADVLQLAFITLSLLLAGESLRAVSGRIDALFDDFADASHGCSPALISAMRRWLGARSLPERGGPHRRSTPRPGSAPAIAGGGTPSHLPPATAVEQLAFSVRSSTAGRLDPIGIGITWSRLRPPEDVLDPASEVLNMPRPWNRSPGRHRDARGTEWQRGWWRPTGPPAGWSRRLSP